MFKFDFQCNAFTRIFAILVLAGFLFPLLNYFAGDKLQAMVEPICGVSSQNVER